MHFAQLIRWLDMEAEAERQRLLERRQRMSAGDAETTGETLLDLVIEDHQPAVGGFFLLHLVKRRRSESLPWNRLRPGSPVILSCMSDDRSAQHGVVSRRTQKMIQVAVEEWPDDEPLRLDLSSDERTRRKQLAAIEVVAQSRGRLAELRKVLLGEKSPRFGTPQPCEFRLALNESQQRAVQFALSAEDVAVIHGPPGTGKTTTLIELISQLVARGQKVLACAPSNTAVDNLLERLVPLGINAVRLGHPARVSEALRDYSLDGRVMQHPDMKVVHSLMAESEGMFRKASKYTRARPARGARHQMRQAARQLKADARRLEQQLVAHVLDAADVICATNTLDEELLGDRYFPWLVIDEACQATEPSCWVPIVRCERVVLAGDHCQLPPTIVSKQAAEEGFARSMMEQAIEHHGAEVNRRLDIQYRMHQDIMNFSSAEFYEGSLQAHDSVAEHQLADLPGTRIPLEAAHLRRALTFMDTAGAGYEEVLEPDGESRLNPDEGRFVLERVGELINAGVAPEDIAIIAPYAGQVRWLRNELTWEGVEIDTVDGFQGREKEAVVISLVRSNSENEIGFLADTRRMNVALTRARRNLIVVGDSATLAAHDFYRDLIEYAESIDAYVSVFCFC